VGKAQLVVVDEVSDTTMFNRDSYAGCENNFFNTRIFKSPKRLKMCLTLAKKPLE
jgi:hypothetical protein